MSESVSKFTWFGAAVLVFVFVLASPHASQAERGKPARVGVLRSTEPPASNLDAFRVGMRELGHVEGRTYVIVPAWGKSRADRKKLPKFVEKLIAGGVDIIVTVGSRAGRAAKQATKTIPIVMASSADPIAAGLVNSLAMPGGNVTGMSAFAVGAALKRLEVLRELVPGLRRVGAVGLSTSRISPLRAAWRAANESAASRLGLEVIQFNKRAGQDFDALFEEAKTIGLQAVSIRATPGFSPEMRRQLVAAALRAKLPNMHTTKALVKLGGLVSLGTSRPWLYRRAATYVDKILKGAKPADLPVERPTRFELVINLKTARAMGITVPRSLLLRADEVIE